MRVVHFCNHFSSLSETFIYDYVTELERQGVDNHVLTHRRLNKESRPFPKVHVVPKPGRWNIQRLCRRLLTEIGLGDLHSHMWPIVEPQIKKTLSEVRPDIIHAHFGQCGVQIVSLAEQLDIPLVVTFYGIDISKLPQDSFWRDRYRELWEKAEVVTVLSEEMRGKALDLGCPEAKLRIVHLSRNLNKFPYQQPTGRVSNFVSVGRLTEKKGHEDVLRAFHRVIQEGHTNLQLRIIGAGHLRERLADYISLHNLEQWITLMGAIPNDKVVEEMQVADAFILCSKTAPNGDREGTPTALVEAQAVGLPCISTRHAGIPEMIPEETHCLLADEEEINQIADRIRQFLKCKPREIKQIARRGRAKIEREFNLRREVEKLKSIYSGILDIRYGAS